MQSTPKKYPVERILKHKEINGVRWYLIKWEGYPIHRSTWETEDYLDECRETLMDYQLRWFGKTLLPAKKNMKYGTDHYVLFADEDTFTLDSEESRPLPAFTNLETLLSPSEESSGFDSDSAHTSKKKSKRRFKKKKRDTYKKDKKDKSKRKLTKKSLYQRKTRNQRERLREKQEMMPSTTLKPELSELENEEIPVKKLRKNRKNGCKKIYKSATKIKMAPIAFVAADDEEQMVPQDPFQGSPDNRRTAAHRPLARESSDENDVPCDPEMPRNSQPSSSNDQVGDVNVHLDNNRRDFHPEQMMAEARQNEQDIPLMDLPGISNMLEVLQQMRRRMEEENDLMWRYDGSTVSRDEIREAIRSGRGIRQFLPPMTD
ncbi:unnamed protein product [Bursaphelenchus xylophilus]|uniref:(pine wood nematode) hypothetical protein n=1 Tax=Bursaphelenchus xylophilus TaxID=6326 RepID=A0A1I7SS50_BURXY|nr:unnamed protein product [Bursaphelenchus xylophilus]CAG9105666.1 unnamed protein product [Bursaphelenchus xylophilus]